MKCLGPECDEPFVVVTLSKGGRVRYKDARLCAGHLRDAETLGYEARR